MNASTENLLNDIGVLNKLYDYARIVDPLSKTVIKMNEDLPDQSIPHCHKFWDRNTLCDNCISMRAFRENETIIKIEYKTDSIFLVTAIPHQINNGRVVIELMKDITNSLQLSAQSEAKAGSSEIYALIDNMNNLTLRDHLTGVFNKRYIGEKMPVDLLNAALSFQDLSIIMADIDHFKAVNDTYGHQVGDQVLKHFTDTIGSCLQRGSDWLSRYGGEEFIICLPGAGQDRAVETAEAMRKAIESRPILCNDNTIRITASFGVHNSRPHLGDDAEQLIRYADQKLYLAKKNGRNRVEY